MDIFNKQENKFSSSEEICQFLRDKREEQGLTIQNAEDSLKIKAAHLEAVERGEFQELSAKVYLKGLIKQYASWLKIKDDDISLILESLNNEVTVDSALKEFDAQNPGVHLDKKNEDKIKTSSNKNKPKLGLPPLPSFSFISNKSSLMVILGSIIAFVLIYSVWSFLNKSKDIEPYIAYDDPDKFTISVTDYWHIKPEYYGKNLVIAANDKATLFIETIVNSDKNIESYNLDAGSLQFITPDENTRISVDNAEVVDVFADDGNNSFIGKITTLKK